MTFHELFLLITCALYALGTAGAVAGIIGRSANLKKLALSCTLTGFASHTLLLLKAADLASRADYLLILAWSLMAVGLLVWWRLRHEVIMLLLPPLGLVGLLIFVLSSQSGDTTPFLSGPLFFIHLIFIFLSIGLIALAAVAGLIFLWQEYSIKAKTPLAGFRKDLPSLAVLDKVNAMAAALGFPCYTLGLVCGFFWAGVAWGSVFSGDPKEFVSLFIWLIYALLFHLRLVKGWRGRKPALLAVAVFAATLFSLLIVNNFLPTHHSFQPFAG